MSSLGGKDPPARMSDRTTPFSVRNRRLLSNSDLEAFAKSTGFGDDASSSMLSGMMDDPSMHTLILEAKASKSKGTPVSKASHGRDDSEEDGSDGDGADATKCVDTLSGQETPQKTGKHDNGASGSKWWDLDTNVNRAERTYKKKVDKCRERMEELSEQMTVATKEFRSNSKLAEKFQVELRVVVWRHSWLSCVLSGQASKLKDMLQQVLKSRGDNESVSDKASSQAVFQVLAQSLSGLVTLLRLAAYRVLPKPPCMSKGKRARL